jgi:hypothetical protein
LNLSEGLLVKPYFGLSSFFSSSFCGITFLVSSLDTIVVYFFCTPEVNFVAVTPKFFETYLFSLFSDVLD